MPVKYPSIALARGLSVLFMPSIHIVMLYSQPSVAETGLGYLLRFFAECVSSHLYMFLMGFFLTTRKRRSVSAILHRSCILFGAGYLLNIFRTYLPGVAGLLPDSFLAHYHASSDDLFPLILTGDILQFAGIAYGLTALVERLPNALWTGSVLYLIIACTSPRLWGIQTGYALLNHFLNLLFSKDTTAFFPVFPWLCYPLAGMVAAKWLQQRSGRNTPITALFVGFGCLLAGVCLYNITPAGWEPDFYRSGPGSTLLHTGLVLLWLVLFRSLSNSAVVTKAAPLLLFCNRNITAIYLSHWIIIGWGIGLAGYQKLDFQMTLLAICIINLMTALFILFLVRPIRPLNAIPL